MHMPSRFYNKTLIKSILFSFHWLLSVKFHCTIYFFNCYGSVQPSLLTWHEVESVLTHVYTRMNAHRSTRVSVFPMLPSSEGALSETYKVSRLRLSHVARISQRLSHPCRLFCSTTLLVRMSPFI